MRIEQVELRRVEIPLRESFRTSTSTRHAITHVLVRVRADGVEGWGECSAPVDPFYAPETAGTCWHILRDFLVPMVLGRAWDSIEELEACWKKVRGNHFARAGLEMACWDALCRRDGRPLAKALGGTRTRIDVGVSLGIEDDTGRLLARIGRFLDEGYRRIKLKIAPGRDVNVVRLVRARYPDIPLQVDANSAYTLDDIETLEALDDFHLLLIEQPLAHDDIIDHAVLQKRLRTPICLDESLHGLADVRKALDIGACRVVNIKVGRVGGLLEARRIHDYCLAREVPVWCGGMHEFGIGRAANVAISSLPGFTMPGDVSGSDKYYETDLVEPAIRAVRGEVAVPEGPGLGHEPVPERIERFTTRRWVSGG